MCVIIIRLLPQIWQNLCCRICSGLNLFSGSVYSNDFSKSINCGSRAIPYSSIGSNFFFRLSTKSYYWISNFFKKTIDACVSSLLFWIVMLRAPSSPCINTFLFFDVITFAFSYLNEGRQLTIYNSVIPMYQMSWLHGICFSVNIVRLLLIPFASPSYCFKVYRKYSGGLIAIYSSDKSNSWFGLGPSATK